MVIRRGENQFFAQLREISVSMVFHCTRSYRVYYVMLFVHYRPNLQ